MGIEKQFKRARKIARNWPHGKAGEDRKISDEALMDAIWLYTTLNEKQIRRAMRVAFSTSQEKAQTQFM